MTSIDTRKYHVDLLMQKFINEMVLRRYHLHTITGLKYVFMPTGLKYVSKIIINYPLLP